MSYKRILIAGKNKDIPKTIRLPFGVGVDGTETTALVRVAPDECKCTRCGGWGYTMTWDGNPSHRDTAEPCPHCNEGIAKVAA